MIPRLIIAFIILAIGYIKYPLILGLTSDPDFVLEKLEIYSILFVIYTIFEVTYSIAKFLWNKRNEKHLSVVLDNMRGAVEAMISEKYPDADKCLDKIEKITGDDVAIINWMRGCNKLYENHMHEAKAKFYQAAYSEKTILGGYSLYKLATIEGNNNDAYDALKHIVKHVKDVPDSILRNLVKYQLLNKEFKDARENIKRLKDKHLMGISYFLENSTTFENLKLAFDNAPEIPDIAISYAKKLLFLNETRKAKKVIMQSWKLSHAPEIFRFFTEINPDEDIKIAKKFLKDSSFEGFIEFALLLYQKGIFPMAYKYFKEAFVIYPTEKTLFYINELREKLGKTDDKIMKEELIVDETVLFPEPCWMCSNCRIKLNAWDAFCPSCNELDSVKWTYHKEHKKLLPKKMDNLLSLNMR